MGFWLAEGGGGREMEARVASMAAWMADDGAEDWVLGMGMEGVASSGLKPANRLCALSGKSSAHSHYNVKLKGTPCQKQKQAFLARTL